MANVIKHKRGSGSDPAANNLVLGELAIRTDVGKLFTKMDSGAIAEIAGGGSDIAINTLSSSSATGGGSATFNGSAYRFTLSAPPSVSAQQLLVSINGVIQKPVAGTGQPSEGFSVSGNDIILGDAPATGADFFILTFKSLGVSEPADNSVTSAKIVDGAIVNADVNASAAIARTKLANVDLVDDTSPQLGGDLATNGNDILIADNDQLKIGTGNDLVAYHDGTSNIITNVNGNLFIQSAVGTDGLKILNNGAVELFHAGNKKFETTSSGLDVSGNINTTGNASVGETLTVTGNNPNIVFTDSNSNPDFKIYGSNGAFSILDSTNAVNRFVISSSGGVTIGGNTDFGAGIDVTGAITATGTVTSGTELIISGAEPRLTFVDTDNNPDFQIWANAQKFQIHDSTNSQTRLLIDSSGNLGLGTTSPATKLHIEDTTPDLRIKSTNANLGQSDEVGRISIHTSDPTTPTGVGEVFRIKTFSANANGADYSTELSSRAGSGGGESAIRLGQGAVGAIAFRTNTSGDATERMRIDSSGRVLIGTTSTSGISGGADDLIIGSIGDSTSRGITFATTADATIRWADAGDNAMGRIQYLNNTDVMTFHTSNAPRLRLDSDGMKFGSDTAAANAISDYEEGTYTPSVQTTNGVNAGTSGTPQGTYIKIGRLVYVTLSINVNSFSGVNTSGFIRVYLPFTAENDGIGTEGNMFVSQWSISNQNISWMAGEVQNGFNFVYIHYHNGSNNNTNVMTGANANGEFNIRATVMFRVP